MTLTRRDLEEIADELEAIYDPELVYRPRFNLAPTDRHLMVRAAPGPDLRRRRLEPAKWGLRGPRGPIINARAETAAVRGNLREAFLRRRCLVPADGFYEWTGSKEARQPHWIHRRDGRLLLLAGLYDEGDAATGPLFTVLTTSPNALMAGLHDRMPVILDPAGAAAWLAEESPAAALPALLRPAPDDALEAVAVSRRVNSVKNDDPGLLQPEPAGAKASGQLDLI